MVRFGEAREIGQHRGVCHMPRVVILGARWAVCSHPWSCRRQEARRLARKARTVAIFWWPFAALLGIVATFGTFALKIGGAW